MSNGHKAVDSKPDTLSQNKNFNNCNQTETNTESTQHQRFVEPNKNPIENKQ